MPPQAHGAGEGEGVAHARLFLVRRADPDIVGEVTRDLFQHFEAGGVDAIIVGEENFHASGSSRVSPPI